MQIGTSTSASATLAAQFTSATTSNLVSMSSTAGASMVSIGPQGIPITGFKDYTASLTQGLWQFDLSSVMEPKLAGLSEMTVSEKQQKEEAASVSRAFELMNTGQVDEARGLMKSLLAKNNTNSAAVHALGYAEMTAGNYDEAEQHFLRAHAMNATVGYDRDAENARILNGDKQVALSRARQLVQSADRRDDGIRILIELTKQKSGSATANIALGDAMIANGDVNDGLLQYSNAIANATADEKSTLAESLTLLTKRMPKSSFVRQIQGRIALDQERYADALAHFSDAASLSEQPTLYDKDIARAHVGLGRASLAEGRISEALERFEKARGLASGEADVKAALAEGRIARADEYVRFGVLSNAATEYSEAASLLIGRYGDAKLRERAAASAYAVGRRLADKRIAAGTDISDELVALQAAYDLNPKSTTYARKLADTRVALGDQLTADGNLREAALAYERAYSLDKYDAGYKQKMIAGFTAWGDLAASAFMHDDAIAAYRKAYDVDVWNSTSKNKLAGAYQARGLQHVTDGKYKEAAHDFADALALRPDDAELQAKYDLYKAFL